MFEGLPKFPCLWSKRPMTARGFYDARCDANTDGWQLVGIPSGAVSGVDCLDIDVEGLAWLDGVWDRLPPTRTQATRSGGRHLFWRHADGLRNSAGRIAPGVDVRADGGY